jgi:putative hydrolase of the HAD superfamily
MKDISSLIFDFGNVISQPADYAVLGRMHVLLQTPSSSRADRSVTTFEDFLSAYSASRQEYDRGSYSPAEYWARVGSALGAEVDEKTLERLRALDVECWFRMDETMLGFIREMKSKVAHVALLSNMNGDGVVTLRSIPSWLDRFDAFVLSCEYKVVKPEPAIYELILGKLGADAGECLFIDDLEANIDGARAVGMNGFRYDALGAGLAGLRAEIGGSYRLRP